MHSVRLHWEAVGCGSSGGRSLAPFTPPDLRNALTANQSSVHFFPFRPCATSGVRWFRGSLTTAWPEARSAPAPSPSGSGRGRSALRDVDTFTRRGGRFNSGPGPWTAWVAFRAEDSPLHTTNRALAALNNRRRGLCIHFQGGNFQTPGLTCSCHKGNERPLCSKHLRLKRKKNACTDRNVLEELKTDGISPVSEGEVDVLVQFEFLA